jgi:hypothetical protein
LQDNRIDALLQMLTGEGGADPQKAQKQPGLSSEQQAMFQKALTDKAFAQQLLRTPQAQQIIKKLQENGGKNGAQ